MQHVLHAGLIVLALAAAVPACGGDPTAPDTAFSFTVAEAPDFEAETGSATGGAGRIAFRGLTWTGCGGNTLSGKVQRIDDTGLAVVVTDHGGADGCYTVATGYRYEGTYTLPPGTYDLRILHRADRPGVPPRTVFSERVTVR